MFDSRRSGELVVIDEGQMLNDDSRGWAWTRALMENTAEQVHVACSPNSLPLIERMLNAIGRTHTVVKHERLTPLTISKSQYNLNSLLPQTILVAFSRLTVLALKTELEQRGRRVSAIYGALPPEVRHRQAERFASGETEICVATDAVGMGLNLPAEHVVFFEMVKFDGKQSRGLTAAEIAQISGRAGRFGLQSGGFFGALSKGNMQTLQAKTANPVPEVSTAYIAPTAPELAILPGTLANRLAQWAELKAVPEAFR